MKFKIKLKISKFCNFYRVDCNLWWSIFCDEFFDIWACTYFFSLLVIFIYLRCYTKNDFHLTLLCKIKWLKKLMDQKNKDVLFFSMLFLCIHLLIKIYIDMWVGAQMGEPICHITIIPIYLKSIFWKLQVDYTNFLHIFFMSLMAHLEFLFLQTFKQKNHKIFLLPTWYGFIKKSSWLADSKVHKYSFKIQLIIYFVYTFLIWYLINSKSRTHTPLINGP